MSVDDVLVRLRALGDASRLAGMARYGIATDHAYGVTVGELRTLAREIGRDRDLAAALWRSGVHEARILASLLDDPALVDDAQFELWAGRSTPGTSATRSARTCSAGRRGHGTRPSSGRRGRSRSSNGPASR